MKRVAYVSTLAFSSESPSYSTELVHILNEARVFNKQHDISGVLLVHHNTAFQMLEGPPAAVAQLLYRIGRDSRHHHFSVIMNMSVEQRLFGNWSMRLISRGSPLHQKAVSHILNHCFGEWEFNSNQDSVRVNDVFDQDTAQRPVLTERKTASPLETSTAVIDFRHKNLHLLSWPKPNQVPMSRNLMSLCSALMGKSVSYESVISMHLYKSEQALNDDLKRLRHAKLIDVSEAEQAQTVAKAAGGDRFSRVLQRFISSVRKEA